VDIDPFFEVEFESIHAHHVLCCRRIIIENWHPCFELDCFNLAERFSFLFFTFLSKIHQEGLPTFSEQVSLLFKVRGPVVKEFDDSMKICFKVRIDLSQESLAESKTLFKHHNVLLEMEIVLCQQNGALIDPEQSINVELGVLVAAA
jgi:hypothetical protein